ncbi:hypothetical protein CEXT_615221 [Caerostris extrusa]|uniref:Uncharacterized protein n=1 Tax=Caerostris extrusa TaxID=172846 RepID=A0AAV4PQY8_CAEEX|nr:hypothetical protein CEXT_615221 [Caerostris extrusa]
MSFYLQRILSMNCCSQKGENSNIDKAEKWFNVVHSMVHSEPYINLVRKKAPRKKKEKLLSAAVKALETLLLEQEMSGFWFRLGAKDNGRLTLDPRELPPSLAGSYGSA